MSVTLTSAASLWSGVAKSSARTRRSVMANPYESPSGETQKSCESPAARTQNLLTARAIWWLAFFASLYPALLIAAFYGTWLIASLILGHMPRPSLDDPKSIGLAVDIPYLFTAMLLLGFPVAAVLGVAIQLSVAHRSWLRRLLRCAVLVAVWASTILFLQWDPLLVVEWYFD